MKKILLGSLIALTTFSLGISTFSLSNLKSKPNLKIEISHPPQELKISKAPVIKVASSSKLSESEVYEDAVIEDNYGWYQLDGNPKMSDLGSGSV